MKTVQLVVFRVALVAALTLAFTLTSLAAIRPTGDGAGSVVYHVSTTGSDAANGLTEETAFATLPAAVAAAEEGSVIRIAPGVYPLEATLVVSKGVSIVGTGVDREEVVIKRSKGNIRVVVLDHPAAELRHLVVSDGIGQASNPGANVSIAKNGGRVIDCILRNAVEKWQSPGGGLYVNSAAGYVRDCVITNNVTKDLNHEGGVGLAMTAGRVENCLIAGNRLPPSCGVWNNRPWLCAVRLSGGELVHCTIADNVLYNTGGVYVESPDVRVVNCVIARNCSISGAANAVAFKKPEYADCLISCATDAPEQPNETCVPFDGGTDFADPVAGDYRLHAGSAGLDHCQPAVGAAATDLEGAPRVVNGLADVGAYELQAPSSLVAGIRLPGGRLARAGQAVVLEPVLARAGGDVRCSWDFGDGATAESAGTASVSHLFGAPGLYEVLLTATDSAGTSVVTRPLHVLGDAILVAPGNLSAAPPYATAETAAPDLLTAYAYAEDGCDLRLLAGTHFLPEGMIITKELRFLGATGDPADVSIKPKGGIGSGLITLARPGCVLSGLTLRDNSSSLPWGGAMAMIAPGTLVTNCHFRECKNWRSGASGSAIEMLKPGVVSHCLFEGCTVDDNRAPGGTVAMRAPGRIENCLFLRNRTALASGDPDREKQKAAAGVFMTDGVVRNCSFIGNRSLNVGGIYLTGGAVTNCLFSGNTSEGALGCPTATVFDGDASAFHRCASDTVLINDRCFAGIIDFEDAAAGNYAPGFGSVALGNGWGTPEELEATDFAGNPRVSPDGRSDIGCIEKVGNAFGAAAEAFDTVGIDQVTATFRAVLPTLADPSEASCLWDFGDGSTLVADGATSVSHLYETLGDFDVTLTATHGDDRAVVVLEQVVHVRPRVLYVSAGNPASAAPYDTEEKASSTLAAALGYAIDGCEVLVSAGRYPENELVIDKGIAVRGVSGRPDDVVIDGEGRKRTMTLDHPDAWLSAVTLERGRTGGGNDSPLGGANVLIHFSGGTVSNCVIRNGDSWYYCGGGVAVRSDDGLVTHCVITNNVGFDYNFQGGSGAYILRGTVRECLIAGGLDNGAKGGKTAGRGAVRVDGGALVNCTVVDNKQQVCGGVYCTGGGVTNCVIARNETLLPGSAPEADVYGGGHPERFVACAAETILINDICVAGDLAFIDAAEGDYRLGDGSVAIDAGSMALAEGMPSVDLDGKPRLQHRVIDIGCYETIYKPKGMVLILR